VSWLPQMAVHNSFGTVRQLTVNIFVFHISF